MARNQAQIPSKLSAKEILDLYFLDARSKLIDLAAFLDRIDRSAAASSAAPEDFRLAAFKKALEVVVEPTGEKARRVQESLSDPTTEPLESAAGMKGAAGAWPGKK